MEDQAIQASPDHDVFVSCVVLSFFYQASSELELIG